MGLFKRNLNAGNLLVVAGIVGLGITLAVPGWTAARVARIEGRATDLGAALLAAACTAPGADSLAGDDLLSALPPDARERLELADPLPGADGKPTGVCLTSKHYCYLVTRTPANEAADPQPREVYTWPRGTLATGRTAFRFAEDTEAVFTRNLQAGYAGFGRPPSPGAGAPRRAVTPPAPGTPGPGQLSYRGRDDERWLGWPRHGGSRGK